jgi:hypothetical protein
MQKVLRPGLLFFGCHLHPSFFSHVVFPQTKKCNPLIRKYGSIRLHSPVKSVVNPIDTAGSLTYGKGDAKHSNGRLFRFLTGSPYRIDKQYSVGLRAVTVRAIRAEGGIHTQTVTAKKLQQPYKQSRCSRFSATKNHRFRTCRP